MNDRFRSYGVVKWGVNQGLELATRRSLHSDGLLHSGYLSRPADLQNVQNFTPTGFKETKIYAKTVKKKLTLKSR